MRTLGSILFSLVLPVLLPCAGVAQAVTSMIISNGPVSARFNIVVLSEGYTAAQLSQFKVDATNAVNTLFSREPFAEYRPYCNAFCVSVASTQSGADHPSIPRTVSTYFNSSYDLSDKLITIDSVGQGRVEALVAGLDCDLAILLVNDPVKGGSDGGGKTAIASIPGFNTLVHEVGHVVANLGDEYTRSVPNAPDTEEPNTTRETDPSKIKWRAWISPETPIPTPPTFDFIDVVGLFEGAHYHTTGWYRPKFQCTMQNDNILEFCEVCREALTLALTLPVNRVATPLPAEPNFHVTSRRHISFSVALVDPATHQHSLTWTVNGSSIPANGSSILLDTANLPSGTSTVQVVIHDPTAFVRTDSSNVLFQTNTWTVVLMDPLVLTSPALVDGQFVFSIQGAAPNGSFVEHSTNLLDWTRIATNPPSTTPLHFTNAAPEQLGTRYFRAISR